jgi:hypothetical protein
MFSADPEVAKRQMLAVVFMLTAFGHIDGKFSMDEKRFVQEKIAALVEKRMVEAVSDPLARHAQTDRVIAQFQRVAGTINRELVALLSESVAEGESQEQFIHAKITLRCYELLHPFDEAAQEMLFAIVDEFILADGVAHPAEEKLRDDLKRLLSEPVEITEFDAVDDEAEKHVQLAREQVFVPRADDHPFFARMEQPYPRDQMGFAQYALSDIELVKKVRNTLAEQRKLGAGRLKGIQRFADLAGQAPFLDGHVYVLPPNPSTEYELIVLGDLHGCYSCLKAALMQTDFLAKVQAHANDPEGNPDTRLVLLGDYIDRGRFSYDGILRAAMQLYVTVPHAVYMLRGNHEYYIEHQGRILAPVRPAEGMMSLEGIAGDGFFKEYMQLFEEMPTSLAFDRIFFAHAGIPRDASLREKWQDLSSLNDPELRFEMMWSDPSDTETVPDELQKKVARFGYGSSQFRSFMARIGCVAMVRGHERITEGFRVTYEFPDASLYTLFSAGGETCLDLPETSNYREVTPRALSIRSKNGASTITPFVIDWAHYNDGTRNRFFT